MNLYLSIEKKEIVGKAFFNILSLDQDLCQYLKGLNILILPEVSVLSMSFLYIEKTLSAYIMKILFQKSVINTA